ncbi:hypothetical protein F4Y93_06040 [Candidatus Poribacteria bacterium]|nr:hypothetical protein [Candidatus Poribacteria bacterium]
MKVFRGLLKHYAIYLIGLILVFAVLATMHVLAEVAYASFKSELTHSNKLDLGNGESAVVKVQWNKDVSGFALDDLAYNIIDANGSSITKAIKDDPSMRLPRLSRFRALSGSLYEVTLTAPFQYYGRIKTGRLILSFAFRQGAIDEEYDHGILEFSWGEKAECWIYPWYRYLENGKSMKVALFWDRNVDGAAMDDLSVDVGELLKFGGNRSFQEVTVKAPAEGSGTMKLTLREDACREGNNETSLSIRYGPPRQRR